jgi:hypothetical protein
MQARCYSYVAYDELWAMAGLTVFPRLELEGLCPSSNRELPLLQALADLTARLTSCNLFKWHPQVSSSDNGMHAVAGPSLPS